MQGHVAQFYRREIYELFNGICVYCGKSININEMEVDHVIPFSEGGNGSWRNSLPSCVKCNRLKFNRAPPVPVQLPLDFKKMRLTPMVQLIQKTKK